MFRLGLLIFGVGLVLLLILAGSGSLSTWDPTPGTMRGLVASMLAILIGGLLTLIAGIRLAIDRFRHRREDGAKPRVTPL